MTTSSDSYRAAAAPLIASGGHRTLDASTSPASIALAAGVHEVFNAGSALGSALAFVRIGTAVSIPSSGDAEVSAQGIVPVGGALVIALPEAATVHALTGSGSATLHFVRKAAL